MRNFRGMFLFALLLPMACSSGSRGTSSSGTNSGSTAGVAQFRYVNANGGTNTATINEYDGTVDRIFGTPLGLAAGVESVAFSRDYKFFYICSRLTSEIAAFTYDAQSGVVKRVDDTANGSSPYGTPAPEPFFLVAHPSLDVLYALCDRSSTNGAGGSVIAFNINTTTGALTTQGANTTMQKGSVVDWPAGQTVGGCAPNGPTGMAVFDFLPGQTVAAIAFDAVACPNSINSGLGVFFLDGTGAFVQLADGKVDGGNIRPGAVINVTNAQLFIASSNGIQPHLLQAVANPPGSTTVVPALETINRPVIANIAGTAVNNSLVPLSRFRDRRVYCANNSSIISFEYSASPGQAGGLLVTKELAHDTAPLGLAGPIAAIDVSDVQTAIAVGTSNQGTPGADNTAVLKIDQVSGAVNIAARGTAQSTTNGDNVRSIAIDRD